jgi:concanavalin A-like lectin/glucanase superfamily protein/Big-like domain-containing protein
MVVRYGPEPSVHLYDRQNMAAGPYANPVDGASTINTGSYVGISPDGQFLVGYQGANGSAGLYHMGQGVSWKINHANHAIAATENVFWSLCGDHGTFISPSDGRDYMIVSNCNNFAELWRVDITNNIGSLDEAGQKALPNNFRLIAWPTWKEDGSHVSTVAKGPLRDWTFYATEDGTDSFNSATAPWHAYRQEIVAFNVVTGEIRRLAHHRSRSVDANYYAMPRLSASWGGKYVGWASNFNQSGVIDIYAVPFSATFALDTTPPAVSITSPLAGSILSGMTTVSATASDNVGVAGVQFKLDGANLGAEVLTAPYAATWDPSTTINGAHSLTAVARDAAGNTTTSTAVAVTVSISTTPPVISAVAASGIWASGATIAWTTDKLSDSQVDYGPTTGYGSSTTLNAALVTSHSPALSGLSASTVYHYRVKSRAAGSNLATSGDSTFTTTTASSSTPIAYWPFDEGTGTIANDASGNGHVGTLVNGPAWTAGRINLALSFDGVSNYVSVADAPALDAFPLTITAWINTTATTGVRGIVNKYAPGSFNGYQIFMNNGALCAWYLRDSANYAYDGGGCTLQTPGYNDGKWHQVVYVVDSAGGRLYVDGTQTASLAWTGSAGPTTTTQPLHIGDYPGITGGAYFAGVIDDVHIYNRALSPPARPLNLSVTK